MPEMRHDAREETMRDTISMLAVLCAFIATTTAGPDPSARADAAFTGTVETLLRATLTADRAVQIALLNNRNLQATFEEIGVAKADLLEAGLLKNPSFDASVRFPDGGGGTNNEFAIAVDFL